MDQSNPLSGSQASGGNNPNPLAGSQAGGGRLAGSVATGSANVSQPMRERVVSERVVSQRVLGSSNPIARFGRNAGGQISSRIGGIFIGFILIVASFFAVWYSEKFEKSADLVANMPLLSVEQAATSSGLVKVEGNVTSAPIKTPLGDKSVLYYEHSREELEMVMTTETETQVVTENGQDIEKTIERQVEKPTWVSKINNSAWAEIVLGGKITIRPDAAKKMLNLTNVYNSETDKVREKIDALLPDGKLIAVGEISGGKIEGGKPFIISNQSDSALVASLQSSEKTTWWLLKLATLLLFGFGLYMLLGPILLVLDIIPILGKIGQTGILIVCLLIGLVFTVLSSLLISFWYIILILLVAAVGYLLYMKSQKTAAKGA